MLDAFLINNTAYHCREISFFLVFDYFVIRLSLDMWPFRNKERL